ncbi:MAG: alpha-isopropylmalate synthase regulatory domain-containing protein [Candidatus Peribacteraceae bacterium]|nr:alpha-isopropylmalate synthase regulatory domain-containing protein [Candidatus Peribacteraceae bacterium]
MEKFVELNDVTPRDGDQTFGVSMSTTDKLWFVEHDRSMGIPYVEAGFPGANDVDRAVFAHLKEHPPEGITYSAFGMTRRRGIDAYEDELLKTLSDSGAPILTVVGKASRFQVAQALGISPEENLNMITDTFSFLRRESKARLHLDAEHFFDGFQEDPGYALAVLRAAVREGANRLILCDTNGYAVPNQVWRTVDRVRSAFGHLIIGMHPHNDCGLAMANALAAVEAGAHHVDGTWNGVGERTGNLDLTTLIPNLYRLGYETVPQEHLRMLTAASEDAARQLRQSRHPSQPFVGKRACAHKGGMHASAVAKDPRLYEGSPPETWGNQRTIVGSKQAGLSNVRSLVNESTLLPATLKERVQQDRILQERILDAIEAKESSGFCLDRADASLELLMLRALDAFTPQICILESEVHSTLSVHDPGAITSEMKNGEEKNTRAIVLVRVNGDQAAFHTVAKDDGPIGALCEALVKGLRERFPELPQTVQLLDYHLEKSPKSEQGTHSVVQVTVDWTDGQHRWTTTGVSSNSIDAGWQCIVDAMEYKVQLAQSVGTMRQI